MTRTKWGALCDLKYGKGLRDYAEIRSEAHPYRVFGTNGPIGWCSEPLVNGPGVIIGRKGAYRGVHYSNEPFYVIDTAYYLTLSSEVDIKWAYYQLLTVDLNRLDSGAAIPSTKKEDFYNIDVRLPGIAQQRCIASILSAYTDLIENNRRRIVLLEKAARTLYEEWFVRFRFPGYEHVKIVDGVPEGWNVQILQDLCTDIRDTVQPDKVDIDTPYIGLEHMPRRSITLAEWGSSTEIASTKLRFRSGDILFGKIRPYFHKVGYTLTDGMASSDAIVLRPNTETLWGITLMTVSSDWFIAIASQTMREGSKMPRADWKILQDSVVHIPPPSLLMEFNETILLICEQIKALALQVRKLAQARDLLLPKLISGDIEV